MKKLAIALSVLAALALGASANAETIDYNIMGWQTTCSNTYAQATSTNCLYPGTKKQGRLSGGTITGDAQFVGNSTSGGTLTVNSTVYVTSSTPGVGPATITTSGHYDLATDGTVVSSATDSFACSPTSDTICQTANTPLPVAKIDLYPPSTTIGGTLTYLVQALASSSTNMAWQQYTLTVTNIVPEPGMALLGGTALLSLVALGCIRRKRFGRE